MIAFIAFMKWWFMKGNEYSNMVHEVIIHGRKWIQQYGSWQEMNTAICFRRRVFAALAAISCIYFSSCSSWSCLQYEVGWCHVKCMRDMHVWYACVMYMRWYHTLPLIVKQKRSRSMRCDLHVSIHAVSMRSDECISLKGSWLMRCDLHILTLCSSSSS